MSRIVLVTGGSRGIGAAIASRLAQAGDVVYAASRSGQAPTHPRIHGIVLDVNDIDGLRAGVDAIVQAEGRLDAVVVNAGNGICGPLEEMKEEDVRYQFETCFFGAVKTIGACVPVMRAQGFGRILAVTSFAALVPLPYQVMYSSAKAALEMAVMGYAVELKPFGIQCGCVLPGDTATGFTSARKYIDLAEDSPYRDRFQRCMDTVSRDEQGGMPADRIARAVVRQLSRRRMRLEVVPRADYWLLSALIKLLPRRLALLAMEKLYNKS